MAQSKTPNWKIVAFARSSYRFTVTGGDMNSVEQKVRFAIGSAAAAAAIFAPLDYKWRGVLTAVAADAILTAIYEVSPLRRLIRA